MSSSTASGPMIRVFGGVGVDDVTGPISIGGPKQRRLLALLAMRCGSVVSVDWLAEYLWDDDERPEATAPAIRTYLWRLREALPEAAREWIETEPSGYRLAAPSDAVEHLHFAMLRAEAIRARSHDDPLTAHTLLGEALQLWRGDPFRDLEDLDWARADIERLNLERLEMLEEQWEAALALGRHTQITGELAAFTAKHGDRDRAVQQYALALHRSGRTAEALRVVADHRRLLADESGLDPSRAMVALERSLLAGDASLDVEKMGRPLRGYRLLEEAGTGAFSVVWRGEQPSVNREVAIKQIRSELASQPEFIRRFEAEAHLVARLEHPHIVPLIDFWRDPDSAYLVMRWLPGGTLERRLDDGALGVADTMELARQIGGALSTAHARGIVHRDVKTANILFDEQGNAFLGDFGIALEATESTGPEAALSPGSPLYASPEQIRGERLGPEADVFSLGVVIFECLTGSLPFSATSSVPEMIDRQLHTPYPSLTELRTDVPVSISDAVARATSKDAGARFTSIAEFIAALESDDAAGSTTRAAGGGAPTKGASVGAGEVANPYLGLRAFEDGDSTRFFGRERLVSEILGRLGSDSVSSRCVVVVGPSGSGKSSVVRAGLTPALRAGAVTGSSDWFTTTMVPGNDPFESLEAALLRVAVNPPNSLLGQLRDGPRGILRSVRRCLSADTDHLVVLIDQFEEIFAGASKEIADDFLDALAVAVVDPTSPLRLVATLRADYYHRPLEHPAFATVLTTSAIDVTPLAADELEQAIVEPARLVGVTFEPGLVARVAAEAVGQPSPLPLLQYTLSELFDRRAHGSDTLTIDAYDDLGGLSGALSSRADSIHERANDTERIAIRRIFGRMTNPREGGADLRQRVPIADLGDDAATTWVLDQFGAARLVTFDRDIATREPTVEVAHEALMREWPRLVGWLEDDREVLRTADSIASAATTWDRGGREATDLYRGGRLESAVDLAVTTSDRLRPIDTEFIESSRQAAEADRFTEQNRVRRLRRLVVGVAAALAVALIAGGIAFRQGQRADDQADAARTAAAEASTQADLAETAAAEASNQAVLAQTAATEASNQAGLAETATQEAEFQRIAAVATSLAENDRVLAMLVAVEAFDRKDDVESRGALKTVLMTEPRFLARSNTPATTSDQTARVASDGSWIFASRVAVSSEATEGTWYDTETFETLGSVRVDERWSLVSSDDRSLIAAPWLRMPGVEDSEPRIRQVRVWDGEGDLVKIIETVEPPTYVGFDERSRLVVAEQDMISIHHLASTEPETVIDVDLNAPIAAGDIDSGSALFAAATLAGETVLVDLDTAQVVATTPPSDQRCGIPVCSVAFSPDGSRVAFGVASGAIVIRDTTTWMILREFSGSGRAVSAIAFVDDETLLAGHTGGVISHWDLRNGIGSADDLDSQTADVSALVVLDDERFATLSRQGHLQRWTSDAAGPFATRLGDGLGFTAIAPDGIRGVRTNTPEVGMVTVYDLESAMPITVFEHPSSTLLESAAFSPDGQRLAVTTIAGEIELFDTSSFDPTGSRLEGLGIGPLAFSPDGEHIAVGWNTEGDFGALVWTIESDRTVDMELTIDFQFVTSVAWRPDGAAVTFADRGGDATFDIETGKQIGTRFSVRAQGQAAGIAWEPDGGHLLGAGPFGVSRWNASTRTRTTPIDRESPSEWLALAADANVLATLGTDGRLWTWDLETGTPLGAPIPDQRLGNPLGLLPPRPVISSDGSQLALDGETGTILWNLNPQRWREIACELAGRNMTRDEWARTMGETDYRATCAQWPIGSE